MTQDFSEVKIKLTIISANMTPDEISLRVGLSADDSWQIGEPRGRSGLKWDQHVWRIWEGEESSHHKQATGDLLESCWRRFCLRVAPFTENIRSLSTDNYVEVGVYMLSENMPPFSVDRTVIDLIARLGAALDVDILLCQGATS